MRAMKKGEQLPFYIKESGWMQIHPNSLNEKLVKKKNKKGQNMEIGFSMASV